MALPAICGGVERRRTWSDVGDEPADVTRQPTRGYLSPNETTVVSLLANVVWFILSMTAFHCFRRTKVPPAKAALYAVQLYGIMALGQAALLL